MFAALLGIPPVLEVIIAGVYKPILVVPSEVVTNSKSFLEAALRAGSYYFYKNCVNLKMTIDAGIPKNILSGKQFDGRVFFIIEKLNHLRVAAWAATNMGSPSIPVTILGTMNKIWLNYKTIFSRSWILKDENVRLARPFYAA